MERFITDTVITSKDSIAVTERYITIATEDNTETAIINIKIGLDRKLFRHKRFIEKPVSPYR
jgi:hypothetical protein